MVTVRLNGGLGNQLFQYATGRAVAEARDCQLLLDISGYKDEYLGRRYHLDLFHIRAQPLAVDEQSFPTPLRAASRLRKLWVHLQSLLPIGWRSVYVDRKAGYDPRLFRTRGRVVLIGYWQSEKYFAAIEDSLRQELTLRNAPLGHNARLANDLRQCTSVCVHVRRGDYVSNDSHVALSADYYQRAASQMQTRLSSAVYYVFSDDISWCRERLCFANKTVFVDHNGPERDYEDLRLMSLCKHHIMANSSFSWWGAWLGQSPGQLVIAPTDWYLDASRSTCDLIPNRWERL